MDVSAKPGRDNPEPLLPPNPVVFKVTGEDSATYLQSQVSADLPKSGDPEGKYTLWLNAKGRIEGDSYVIRTGETDFILVSFHTEGSLLKELVERHIIADDVEVEWLSGMEVVGFREDAVPEGMAKDASAYSFKEKRGGCPILFFVDEAENLAGWMKEAAESGALRWKRERILRGIPAIPSEAGERDTPMDLDLDGAISFEKGCFLGQEVMAKVKARGRRRKQLEVLKGASGDPPEGESPLKGGGRVLCSVAEASGWLALAQVRVEG